MDELNNRLLCATEGCQSLDHHQGIQAVYTWRSALLHMRAHEKVKFVCTAQNISGTALKQVKELEREASEKAIADRADHPSWECKHCPAGMPRKLHLMQHLKSVHYNADPGESDFYIEPTCDKLGFSLTPVCLISRDLTPRDIAKLPSSIMTIVVEGRTDFRPLED